MVYKIRFDGHQVGTHAVLLFVKKGLAVRAETFMRLALEGEEEGGNTPHHSALIGATISREKKELENRDQRSSFAYSSVSCAGTTLGRGSSCDSSPPPFP